MENSIKRLNALLDELEKFAKSSELYAYEAALNTLGQIECEAGILRCIVMATHKGRR